jgi:Spy/CpxP family protein refolding chaperone
MISKGCTMSNRSLLRRTRQAALASALFVALAGVASADAGPRGGMHGPGGPHGASIEAAIAHVKDKLALNADQQRMFDSAVAQNRAAREAGRAEMIRVRDAMKAELAKPEPDLAAVAAIADDARNRGQAERLKVRGTWLNLYGTFTVAQKQIVRDHLLQRIARHEAWRETMKARSGDKG